MVADLHDGNLGSFRLPSTWGLGQRHRERYLCYCRLLAHTEVKYSVDHDDVLCVLIARNMHILPPAQLQRLNCY